MEELVLDYNHLCTKFLTLARSLHSINTLKLLNLNNTSLTEEAADAIALAISSNHGLEQLYLGNNKLRAGGIKIARALKSISTLQILDLNDNHMPVEVALELASAIARNSSLKQLREELWLDNYLLISNNTALEELWLGNSRFKAGILKVLKALEVVPKLRALDIEANHTPGEVCDGLANFMQCNSSTDLHTLFLEGNDLHLTGATLVEALCLLTNLKAIDLNGNNITGEMADKLAVAIPNMTSLQQLWLKNNNLGTDKVITIAQSLSNLTTIKQLSLTGI